MVRSALGAVGILAPVAATEVSSTDIRRGTFMGDVFGITGPAGLPAVSQTSAMQVSAVWACVSLITGAVSMLPAGIYRNLGRGERQREWSHPLDWALNDEFCPRWSASAGWEYLMLSRLFEGDAYARILRGPNGQFQGLVPWHPGRVETLVFKDGSRLAYILHPEPNTSNEAVLLDQDDVLHVTGLGFDGRRSLSPLRHALRMAGAVSLATQDAAAQFYANQMRPDYALVAPEGVDWDREQIEDLRQQLYEKHAASRGQASRPMLLSGGVKIETISLSNEDAELLGTRQFQIEEIARAFGVPPFMIGHNEKTTSWGSGVAEMGTGFVRYVLRPHLRAFQNEINRKLFRGPGMQVEFDTFELERADLKSLFESFRAAMGRAGEPGFITPNEVRSLINLPRDTSPESDELHRGHAAAAGDKHNAQP